MKTGTFLREKCPECGWRFLFTNQVVCRPCVERVWDLGTFLGRDEVPEYDEAILWEQEQEYRRMV